MRVTIAIPCHNAERWLRQCIQSALDQREVEPEVIVVDDGSTDRSHEIAQGFGDRIRLLSGTRRGANIARNLALDHATGEWIQFLDADDYLEPGKIATQLHEAKDTASADILYSPVWIETWRSEGSSREPSGTSPGTDIFTQWFRWHIPQTGGALWRRSALADLRWADEQPCCQEHELYLRAIIAGLRFRFTPTPGAVYRVWSEETLCRKDPVKVTRVRTALMDKMIDWLAAHGHLLPTHRREAGQACFEMARTWARYDLPAATAYLAERRQRGILHVAGPAAPWKYRLFYKMLGFRRAEQLARAAR